MEQAFVYVGSWRPLELSVGGAKAEQLPQTGLPHHKGNNIGRTCVPDTVKRGGGQCHKNLAGHDSRGT